MSLVNERKLCKHGQDSLEYVLAMAELHSDPERGDRLHLSYLYGAVVLYQPGERVASRILTDYELVLIIEGSATYRSNRDSHDLMPGSVVLARPGTREEYIWDPEQRTRHAYFHFGIKAIPGDWPDVAAWPTTYHDTDSVMAGLFRRIRLLTNRHQDWPSSEPSAADTRLMEALLELFLNRPDEETDRFERDRPEPVRRALKWMREILDNEPQRKLTLPDLAEAAHVTPKHLCRIFHRTIGHSPMTTYRLLRLQLAVALLARSNLSIKEVAQRCGFDDPLYFSRCTSSVFGASPRRIRQNVRSGQPPPATPLPPDLMPRMYW